MKKPRVIFFGTPRFAVPTLQNLISENYEIQVVVTAKPKPSGRGMKLQSSPVEICAAAHKIPVAYDLEALPDADIFVIAAYGKIIPSKLLTKPKYGVLNVHPSLLPKYRGPSPIAGALLAGEKETGVTIMLTDAKIDHGPILAQAKILIEDKDTTETMTQKLALCGAHLLIETIPKWVSDKIIPHEQEHTQATYTTLLTKKDGHIDWKQDAEKILRHIHAYTAWPSAWTTLYGKRIIVLAAHIDTPQPKELAIETGDHKTIIIDSLKPEGGKTMSGVEFLSRHKILK